MCHKNKNLDESSKMVLVYSKKFEIFHDNSRFLKSHGNYSKSKIKTWPENKKRQYQYQSNKTNGPMRGKKLAEHGTGSKIDFRRCNLRKDPFLNGLKYILFFVT